MTTNIKTDRERIDALKSVLTSYATETDNHNGNHLAIQLVQKMAGDSSVKDYVAAIWNGLAYGNWPWMTRIPK